MKFAKNKPQKEFTERMLEVRRVTRVTTGGRRMSFRATILIGNGKGKIGVGVAKGPDVATAAKKATREAYKAIFEVPITRANTVPYLTTTKFKSCRVRIIPASAGTGLKAGSSVRAVLELAGYENVLSKIIGSNNKLNNALATIKALSMYKHSDHFNSLQDKKVVENKDLNKEEETKEEKKEEKKTTKKATTKKTTTKKTTTKKTVKKTEDKKEEKKEEKKTTKKASTKKTDSK